jgi:WD40 repeat protein
MPGEADTRGIDHGSVVPFGELSGSDTIDFTPAPSIPGYEILHEVGRGGMGVVYKAKQISLNRPVALKMILAGSHAGPVERERFRREAEAVATLQNPHIVQIFEIGEANGHLYLALEFVEGGSLAQHLGGMPWSAREAASLVELLARAVHYAHSQGVVHRDLKPGNVLLAGGELAKGRGGEAAKAAVTNSTSQLAPKITDFGLAKRLGDTAKGDGTKTGAVMGTPSYIAPEQASGKAREVGPAADVYALGAILYELLTGRPPFVGETPLETVLQVLHDDPVQPKRLQPSVPRDLETICLKCLDKSPAKRYPGADALADDLRRFLTGEPIKARPLSAWGRSVKWAQRHPALAVLAAVTLTATIALVTVLSVAYAQVKEAVTQKEKEAEAASQARKDAERLAAEKEEARKQAAKLAEENERARLQAVAHNEDLKREAERTRRAAYALQLAQIAAMCERDPKRARDILEQVTRCPKNLRDFTWAYLHRLCQREERIYLDHQPANDSLHAVAYSPTGAFVATAGSAGQVRVWDPRTGRTWAILVGNTKQVLGIAFSPDGGVIATAGADHSVRLWELPVKMLEDAKKSLTLFPFIPPSLGPWSLEKPLSIPPTISLNEAHDGEVNCVAFSPDGRFLVSGGQDGPEGKDGKLQWWTLEGWRPSNQLVGAVGGPASVLATAIVAQQSPQAIWSVRELNKHPGGVKSIAFAASGKFLVAGTGSGLAKVWSPDGANLIRTIANHPDAVLAVAATPDGKVIATVSNGSTPVIRLINAETGSELHRLIGHTASIYSLAFSQDGDLLASAGFDKSVRLWSVDDGQERSVLLGHDLAVNGIVFAPDHRTVVSAAADGTARIWHTTTRPHDAADVFRDLSLSAVSMSSAGTAFFGGDDHGRLRMYRSDVAPARSVTTPGTNPFYLSAMLDTAVLGKIRATAVSNDGHTVLAANETGLFVWHVFRLHGGETGLGFSINRPISLSITQPVYRMVVDPTGHWLATLDQDGVRLWNLDAIPTTHTENKPVKPQGPGLIYPVRFPQDLAFHPDGTKIAVAVGQGVSIIDLEGKVLAEVPQAHPAEVKAVAFGGKDGGLLATGDIEGVVKVWQVARNGELALQAELTGHTGAVLSLAFSPDGSTLASGGYDRTIRLSDPMTGQERAALTGHADRVLRVQFLPDASALISIGRDGAIKRWRAAATQPAIPNSPRPARPGLGG